MAFAAKLLLDETLHSYSVLIFIPAILLSSVLFDFGSGIVATLVAGTLAVGYPVPEPPSSAILPLLLFLIAGLSVAAVTEGLRGASKKLSESKTYADVLFQELVHRTRNDLTTIVSILRLQARSDPSPAVQAAIASAVSRVDVVAKVHDRLRDTADSSRIALKPYIESLCASLADFHRGVRSIAIQVRCDDIEMRSSQAASIGLIVNELVTNAFKYAFPEGRSGAVAVGIEGKEDRILITVTDDGVGCPAEVKSGLGTRLINLLTTQMSGSMKRVPLEKGCEVEISVAIDR
ncbi:MAG: histidine kinase dimerization/phosphoacceptor domain -containing protein [Bradyrhizobium sp.]|uniref:sensor histidine kinase n=1 Tax=Bradyrhizobium sp. TaxID=376 RepID=UPI0029BB1117|nr:histidine kinase dimerization/phosphoacceptor domain -containing protein [Bradyrhizobium sp.]MDX3969121.1 histidine kinase dimerization/phosphoacceptor domain -containing protein [Bradyrhizobium sp.]